MSASVESPFSDEIPELLQRHLGHLAGSAIPPDTIRERVYRSVMGKKALVDTGFPKSQQRYSGILIPLHGVQGTIVGYQYRPDHPRTGANEKVIKYENPAGSSIRLDVPPRCCKHLNDPSIPIWFTEGVKKEDALVSHGACVVRIVRI